MKRLALIICLLLAASPVFAGGYFSGGGGGSAYIDDAGGTPDTPPSAAATDSYAIGDGASVEATGTNGIAIGTGASAMDGGGSGENIAIGSSATAGNTTAADSAIAIGLAATADGAKSVSIGENSGALGYGSIALGSSSIADRRGEIAKKDTISAGGYWRLIQLARTTTDGNAAEMGIDSLTSPTEFIAIGTNRSYAFDITIIAKTAAGATAHYRRIGTIENEGGTTAIVGAVETLGTDDEDTAGFDVSVTADNTNDRLAVTVTGAAATTVRWFANVQLTELNF